MKPKLTKQFKSFALHERTVTERTFPAGYRPTYEDVKPLTCGEDEEFVYTILERFVDVRDMKPLTQWSNSTYAS